MPRVLRPDWWLLGVAVLLLSLGVVMVYSASAIVAADRFADPYLFLKKQLFWALLGAACLLGALHVDYRRLEALGWPILVAVGVMLVLVLLPPLGQPINGTWRWLRLGPLSIQPAELAKLALVIYLAAFLARHRDDLADWRRGFLPPLAVAGGLAALILAQPDLGNCLTLIAVTLALLYLAGSQARHLLLLVAAAVPLLGLAVWLAPYRL
ncbi:MAG: FtsW/RodA/SpoVE family cell cycle protein, partial [Candidatus Rokuibacteriota bacterium]